MVLLSDVTAADEGCTVSETFRFDCAPAVHVRRSFGADVADRASMAHDRTTVTPTAICAPLDPADTPVATTAANARALRIFVMRLEPDDRRRVCFEPNRRERAED